MSIGAGHAEPLQHPRRQVGDGRHVLRGLGREADHEVALEIRHAVLPDEIARREQLLVADHLAHDGAESLGAGLGAALVLARSSSRAVERLAWTADAIAGGDLRARVGPVADGGPELSSLAATVDRMAERLERSTAREREIEERRRDLITAVSHDLRTPLANLRAMIESIDDGVVEDAPTIRRYAAEMRRSVASLVGLVDDLFELARIDAGVLTLELSDLALGPLVDSCLRGLEAEAAARHVTLRAELNGVEQRVRAEPEKVERVLYNLLANALRHTPSDGSVRARSTSCSVSVLSPSSDQRACNRASVCSRPAPSRFLSNVRKSGTAARSWRS